MNKRGQFDDIAELVIALLVIVVVIFVSFLIQYSHARFIMETSETYNIEKDISYNLNQILRTPVEIRGHKATVAEFIALSFEEEPSFRKELGDKIKEIADPMDFPAEIKISYKGETHKLYNSGDTTKASKYEEYIETIQIPSLKEDSIDLIVKKYVIKEYAITGA